MDVSLYGEIDQALFVFFNYGVASQHLVISTCECHISTLFWLSQHVYVASAHYLGYLNM